MGNGQTHIMRRMKKFSVNNSGWSSLWWCSFFFTCCLTYFVWSVMLLFFVWLVWIVPLLHVHYWTGLESNMLWHISSCFYVVLSHIPLSAFFPTYRCTEKPFILMSWFIHKKLVFWKNLKHSSIRRAIDLVSLYFIYTCIIIRIEFILRECSDIKQYWLIAKYNWHSRNTFVPG